MTIALVIIAATVTLLAGYKFDRWHYSEPQRRRRAVRALGKSAGGGRR